MGKTSPNTLKTMRIVVVLFATACFGLGGAVTGVYLALRHIIGTTAVGYAKALGVQLDLGEVRFGPGFVQLLETKFGLPQLPGVSGTIRRIDVELSGRKPTHVLLKGVRISANGDPAELRDSAIRYWENLRRTAATSEPALPKVEWQDLALQLTTASALVPSVSLTDLSMVTGSGPTHDEITLRTGSTHVGNYDLGPLELAVRDQDGTFELGIGPSLLESKWRVTYRDVAHADHVRVSFVPQALQDLFARFGETKVPDALKAATLGGHIEAVRDQKIGRATGSLALSLAGFTPPYPPELKGYRFADTTTLRAEFELDPLLLAVVLKGIELRTGDLALLGRGRLDRELFSARLRAELDATLDCVTLAKGYAAQEIGGELGKWGARNAPKAVRGAVSVKVQIDANTSRLEDAKVVKRIGIGCGMRPMSLTELLSLGLPPAPDAKNIEQLLKKIPSGGSATTMPNLLPPLSELNPFGKGTTHSDAREDEKRHGQSGSRQQSEAH
jgi:hypothetical protein